jgi:UDP-N-acetylglucosamine:LPS N-acetylglucosamine transferase
MSDVRRIDLLLVCTSGGHLLQLLSLRAAWEGFECLWVTERTSDAESLLADQPHIFARGFADRSLPALVRNLGLAWRLIGRHRPAAVLSTGAALSVPFAWIGRARGVTVVHVESVTRVDRLSLSGRLIRPAANRFYVQWPELQRSVPGSRFAGAVFESR